MIKSIIIHTESSYKNRDIEMYHTQQPSGLYFSVHLFFTLTQDSLTAPYYHWIIYQINIGMYF